MTEASAFALIDREPDDALFRRPEGPISGAAFLHAAHQLAAELPARPYVLNICQDRLVFSLALAAAVLRGQVSLLSSDRSPDRLNQLAGSYPDAYAVSEQPSSVSGCPVHIVQALPFSEARVRPNPLIPAGRLTAIVFTSGSTGEPVPHRKTWGALVTRSVDAAHRFQMVRSEPASIVGTVPPQHMYGFETTVLLPLHAPASSWCGRAFYPSDVQTALETVPAPRILVTTPLQIRAVLQAGAKLPPLARVISATAPLFPELAAEAERAWKAPVEEIFGATEVGSIASRRTLEEDLWTMYPRVRLVLPPEGSEGDQALVAAPHTEPYPLSDVIEAPDPVHFRLLGRRADLVKLGGRRASIAGLNSILTSIEGVEDGLFVAPEDLDRRPTARLLAFVVAPGRDPQHILAALRDRVDPVFLPRRVIRVDRLPRNEVGKLTDQALQALRARSGEG